MWVSKRSVLAAALILAILPPGLGAQQKPPFRLDQVERLLLAGIRGIMDDLRRECIAFDLGEANTARLRAAGADDPFIEALRSVCQRMPQPEAESISICGVRALLDVVEVRTERREYDMALQNLAFARDRVDALSSLQPGVATWQSFAREIEARTSLLLKSCEAWRITRLERGLPAPECRQQSQKG